MKFIKKVFAIILILIISFTSVYALPQKEANAFAWGAAVPGGITIGAGGYAMGALALAGVVGVVNDDYGDAIRAHGQQVWQDGTETAMDSLNWSIEQAKNAGTGLVNLQGDFINYVEGQITNMSHSVNEMASLTPLINSTYNLSWSSSKASLRPETSGVGFLYEGIVYSNLQLVSNTTSFAINYQYAVEGMPQYNASVRVKDILRADDWGLFTEYKDMYNSIETAGDMAALLSLMGVGIAGTVNIDEYIGNSIGIENRMREAWESMRDAGLVLPVDSAIPMTLDGQPLIYNPDTDVYKGIDGQVYTGEPAFEFPQPRIREQDENISVPGVYVDTPVLTGNPEADMELNKDIPNTTTNVFTGTTFANPDIATDVPTTPPPPTNTPDWNRPPSKKPPNVGALVITKFPFSLPWDLFGLLALVNAEPKTPHFKLDTGMDSIFGDRLNFNIDVKIDFLDNYIGYFRTFILLGFSIFLILITRRLLGGAG